MPRERRPTRPLDDQDEPQEQDDHEFHDPEPIVEDDFRDHDENVERDTDDIQ